MKKNTLAFLPLSFMLAAANSSLAANDGTLGTSSTGDFEITATIDDLVQISGLDDLPLGSYTGSGDLQGSESFCVYRNSAGTYNVTLNGSGAGNAFTLSETGGTTIDYTITYDDGVVGAPVAMLAGAANNVTGYTPSSSSLNCGGADNATIEVTITNAVLEAATSGSYSGTLSIIIAPD